MKELLTIANRSFCITLLWLLSSASFAADFDFQSLTDGLPPTRATAPFGAFENIYYDARAQDYFEALQSIEKKVYGVEKSSSDPIVQAEKILHLEYLTAGMIQKIASDSKLHANNLRQSLVYQGVQVFEKVRDHSERLFEVMIRTIDSAAPGASGPQLPISLEDGTRLYRANCRMERCPTDEEARNHLKEKKAEFLKNGGSFDEIKVLTPSLIEKFGTLTKVEYVTRSDGKTYVTEGKAGHLLLADGQNVRSAGQIVFVKSESGQVVLLIETNASGTYKPDLYDASQVAREHVAKIKGLDSAYLIVTKGEPLSTQTVKVLLKAGTTSGDAAKTRVAELDRSATKLFLDPVAMFPKLNKSTKGICPNLMQIVEAAKAL